MLIVKSECCPVCVKHLPAHSGVLTAIKFAVNNNLLSFKTKEGA